jgi:NADH:ubiquinone oxidoreductase subunit H
MIISHSYNLTYLMINQEIVMYIWYLLQVAVVFIISVLAETSRVPFDLVEA